MSSEGRVRGPRGVMHPSRQANGYLTFVAKIGGKSVTKSLHRVICTTFHGPPPFAGAIVRHLDGNQRNNRPGNLAWGTQAQNIQDCIAHGTKVRGERTWNAVLTDGLVRSIRRRAEMGETGASMARQLGVSETTVYYIIQRRSWAHVE